MTPDTIRLIGKWLLCMGVMMLIIGIVLAISIGTILTPVMLSGSILVNSVGVTMLRYRGKPEGQEKK